MPIIENCLKQQRKAKIKKKRIPTNLILLLGLIISLLFLLATNLGQYLTKGLVTHTKKEHSVTHTPQDSPQLKDTLLTTQLIKYINNNDLEQAYHLLALHRKTKDIDTFSSKKFTLTQVSSEMKKLGFFKEPEIELINLKIAHLDLGEKPSSIKPVNLDKKEALLNKDDEKSSTALTKNIITKSIQLNNPEVTSLPTQPIQLANLSQKNFSVTKKDISPQFLVTQNKKYLINQTLEQAIDYMRQGKDSEALTLLNSRIVIKQADYRIYHTLSGLYLQANNLDQALRATLVGLRKFPLNHHLLLMKSRVEEKQNKIKQALNTLSQASPELVNNLHYYALMAKLYLKSKRPSIATSLYKKLLNHQPTQSNWWLGLGLSYEANRNNYLAQEAFKKAQEIGSTNPYVDFFLSKKLN